MKAIVVSQPSFELAREQLIIDLTKAIEEREARIVAGDITGMTASPQSVIQHRVITAFDRLANS